MNKRIQLACDLVNFNKSEIVGEIVEWSAMTVSGSCKSCVMMHETFVFHGETREFPCQRNKKSIIKTGDPTGISEKSMPRDSAIGTWTASQSPCGCDDL